MTQKAAARHFQAIANDNFKVGCSEWRHAGEANGRNVVIIAPATSVKAEYYHRFAGFLFENGSDVVTFDYRGIGASRPPDMRAVEASYVDWGRRDLEAVLRYVAEHYPGQPIDVVAHSIGGFAVGLAPSSHLVRRVLTVGAQFAYWKDYAPHKRLQMVLRWHLFMPLRRAAGRLLSPAAGSAGSKTRRSASSGNGAPSTATSRNSHGKHALPTPPFPGCSNCSAATRWRSALPMTNGVPAPPSSGC
jgi:predicted alpha/beta hydrolase